MSTFFAFGAVAMAWLVVGVQIHSVVDAHEPPCRPIVRVVINGQPFTGVWQVEPIAGSEVAEVRMQMEVK